MAPSCVADSFLPPSSLSPAVVYLLYEQLGFQVGEMFRFALTLNVMYGNPVSIYPEIIKPLKPLKPLRCPTYGQ